MGERFYFENLDVYRKSNVFIEQIYSLTREFHKDELFGLTNQLRKASLSILLNIAEGTSRTKKDFSRFINIAKGSVFECAAILQVSLNQDYLDKKRCDELKDNLVEISKMLSGLKNSLQ